MTKAINGDNEIGGNLPKNKQNKLGGLNVLVGGCRASFLGRSLRNFRDLDFFFFNLIISVGTRQTYVPISKGFYI